MKITCWTAVSPKGVTQEFPLHQLSQEIELLVVGHELVHENSLEADVKNFAQCVNQAAKQAVSGLLITLPPDLVGFSSGWLDRLVDTAQKNPSAHFFYGDYYVREEGKETLQTVRADLGDITEREDWGPLWAVRVEWLNSIGGLDEVHHRAAFYDLLLKSWGEKSRLHVGGALAIMAAPPKDASDASLKDKLFFPGRGKLGGFSYLFMDKEEEHHIEEVFYNFLRRQNAWMEGPRTGIPNSPKTSSPTVSVVTPVYNRVKFIGLAIESVQRQTFTDWEYVIVDNGSTDGTREEVRKYAMKDSRIRLIENDQNIIALSLNLGVSNARGKYIAQLDSDDEYKDHTLEKMVGGLEANPTWGIAISYYELMDEAGNSLPEFGIIKHEQYNRNNVLRRDGAGALRCWHKSVIEEFGGFDTKELGHYGEDYDLVLKCGEKYEVGRVHEVCYRYRRHPDNTDVLRAHEMKIRNKTIARLNGLKRRKALNG